MSNTTLVLKLKEFFQGRNDVYAEQNASGGYSPINAPLSQELLQEHLEGKITLGTYLIFNTDKVNFCALDIDNRDNDLLKRILNSAYKIGIKESQTLLEDSGNKGRHIFFRFKDQTQAKKARNLLNIILKHAEITLPIECFPKQDKVEAEKYGNLIKLPLGIHKKSKKRSFFMDLNTFEEIEPEILNKIELITAEDLDGIFEEFNYLLDKNEELNFKKVSNKPKNQTFTCINNILNGVKEGNRDICLFYLCIYFLKIKILSIEEAKKDLINWNIKNTPPLNEQEIDRKIKYVSENSYQNISCSDLKQFCSPECKNLNKKENQKTDKKRTSFLKTENEIIEMIFSEEKGTQFAIFDTTNKKITYESCFKHKDTTIYPFSDDLTKYKIILLPSKADEFTNLNHLIADIKKYIHKYVDLPDELENLCAYYVIFSYLSDCFDVSPYLRFKGDYGSGKSRALKVIGSICYKATISSGATTVSPIFRLIDQYKGTLILDEADFKNSETSDEIMKILNAGYMKGVFVLRSEKGTEFTVKAFDCYGSKVLATRFSWQDKALESRCITVEMSGGSVREDVKFNINAKIFEEETLTLRNKLLMFRFLNHGDKPIDQSLADPLLEPRLNQIMLPLLTVIDDEQTRIDLKGTMRNLNKHLIDDRNLTEECEALHIIIQLWQPYSISIPLRDITRRLNLLGEDKIERTFTERRLARLIREKLFLPTERKRDGTEVIVTLEKLEKLKKKYGIVN